MRVASIKPKMFCFAAIAEIPNRILAWLPVRERRPVSGPGSAGQACWRDLAENRAAVPAIMLQFLTVMQAMSLRLSCRHAASAIALSNPAKRAR